MLKRLAGGVASAAFFDLSCSGRAWIGPGVNVPVTFRKALPATAPRVRYPGFGPRREVLRPAQSGGSGRGP